MTPDSIGATSGWGKAAANPENSLKEREAVSLRSCLVDMGCLSMTPVVGGLHEWRIKLHACEHFDASSSSGENRLGEQAIH